MSTLTTAVTKAEEHKKSSGEQEIIHSVTINKPIEEVYAYWRDFSQLPTFMKHLESVQVLSGKKSHWVTKAPANNKVEWDAEITEEEPNQLIAWRSLPGADVDNSGKVEFKEAPVGRGTEVRVTLAYAPPGGTVGKLIAQLFGEEPSQQVAEDMWRFKSLLETGEIATTEGQTSGRAAKEQEKSAKKK